MNPPQPQADIPTRISYTAIPKIDYESGSFEIAESFSDAQNAFQKMVCNTREAAVHAALVALGWTPPHHVPPKPQSHATEF